MLARRARPPETALDINPGNILVLNDLGLVHEQLGRIEQARSYYERALEIDADFAPAAESLNRLRQQSGGR